MTHIFKPDADALETRIRRENGVKIIVRLGGKMGLMRFYMKGRGQVRYKPVTYREGLGNVTISELAEIQQAYKLFKN